MSFADTAILELNLIDDIEKMENDYTKRTGIRPNKLSHWNPSSHFMENINVPLSMDANQNPVDYIFSYTVEAELKNKILRKLGFLIPEDKGYLITHAGSASIYNVMNYLKCSKIKKLHLFCPVYFTVKHAAEACGIECVSHYLIRERFTGYSLSQFQIDRTVKKSEAVWITNPVYCTSAYFSVEEIRHIECLLNTGIQVIIDESLSTTNNNLANKFGEYPNFTGIYSPHKSICINGNKFSLLVFYKENQRFYDSWSDILCGCLSSGNMVAINHYLSSNFERFEAAFVTEINDVFQKVKHLCHKYSVNYDIRANGYLVTIYFSNIPAQKGWDVQFLGEILERTGCTFIPGARNHFDNNVGFCFRLNLAAWNAGYSYALERCMKLLSSI